MTSTGPFYSEDHEAFRDVLRAFVDSEITPNVDAWERDGQLPRLLHRKAAQIGMFGVGFPEAYGGLGTDDALLRVLIGQEVARCGAGGVNASLLTSYIALPPILQGGSDRLKERVLPPVLAGDKIAALAVTEPSGGSDVAAITTRAVRDGDQYIVNGSKVFITSGMRADHFTVAVRTGDGPGAAGISILVIDADNPGLSRTAMDKMGWHRSDTATLHFDDCAVPADNLLGKENRGFATIVDNFNLERLDVIALATTSARLCLEEAIAYRRERHTFGMRRVDHQTIRHKIAEMARHVLATQSLLDLLAWRVNNGDEVIAEIALAKIQATTTFEYCARETMQIFGGAGYMQGSGVERLYRDARVLPIGGGAEEIMRDLAIRQMRI
ncbi:MAG: acyl-CoA dehydrogenase [Actinomycetia bacterium]|nr:acyl-CoA dehydrogenase [Actinomycetes bacterium]